ncbi:hypothetical protein D3C86_1538520 [compost metagenome]
MPGHADHQSAVVAPVGRPPFLAVGHQRLQVLLERGDVELLDLFPIVEGLAQRVGLAVVLVEDVEVEGIRPPIHARVAGGRIGAVHHRALAGSLHIVLTHIRLRSCLRSLKIGASCDIPPAEGGYGSVWAARNSPNLYSPVVPEHSQKGHGLNLSAR